MVPIRRTGRPASSQTDSARSCTTRISPGNYYPDDDTQHPPQNVWRVYGELLFANWLRPLADSRPQVRREAPIRWTLETLPVDQSNQLDLLIAVNDSVQTLPSVLRAWQTPPPHHG